MRPLRSIVAGTDFTPSAAVALAQALRLAAWQQGRVEAVHVIDTLVQVELEEVLTPMQRGIRESLLTDAERAWKEFRAGIPGAGTLALDLRIGNRVQGILDKVGEARADLLVLGAFGAEGPDVGVGTVASACVRRSACDVLLIREAQKDRFERVLAAVDFSETSLRALDRAVQFAAGDGAELRVLHVLDPPWSRLPYGAPSLEVAPRVVERYREGLHGRLEELARRAAEKAAGLHVQAEVFEHRGHRSGIVTYAERCGAQLVVLGTRGRTNLRDMVLGSTAEKALADSTSCVLAVRPA